MPDTANTRLLLVDDDDDLRETLCLILEHGGFVVRPASNVNEALRLIAAEHFDVLVTDLHVPHEGDGLTVVGAMRHANANAATIIFSAYPEMKQAADALLAQTDDIFVKPAAIGNLVELIRARLTTGKAHRRVVATVATILEEGTEATIRDWLLRVYDDPKVLRVELDNERRTAHLPQLFRDLIYRLRNPLPLGSRALTSAAAAEHGLLRREQGYTAAMMVEESRMLQVSIFQTLQNNLNRVNFSLLLEGVMTIADEVDSQLAQAMMSYISEAKLDVPPMSA